MPEGHLRTELDIKRAGHVLERERFVLANQRDRFDRDQAKRTRWLSWTTFVVTTIVGLAAAVVGIAQGFLGWNAYKLAQLDSGRRDKELDLKTEEVYSQKRIIWVKYVDDNDAKFKSNDPELMCGTRTKLHTLVGDEFFSQYSGKLPVLGEFCSDAQKMATAKTANADGAAMGWTRRNPEGTGLLVQSCEYLTENRHGKANIIETRTCALPENVSKKAVIYAVTYQCIEYRCGWSYNPDGGYSKNVKVSDDKRSITWKRQWDGDPATERYLVYYEMPT